MSNKKINQRKKKPNPSFTAGLSAVVHAVFLINTPHTCFLLLHIWLSHHINPVNERINLFLDEILTFAYLKLL